MCPIQENLPATRTVLLNNGNADYGNEIKAKHACLTNLKVNFLKFSESEKEHTPVILQECLFKHQRRHVNITLITFAIILSWNFNFQLAQAYSARPEIILQPA